MTSNPTTNHAANKAAFLCPTKGKAMKITDATIEALARRNYEAAMSAPWEKVADYERGDWLEEAREQAAIILEGLAA